MPDIFWSDFRMPDGAVPGPDDVVVVHSGDRLIFDEAASPVTIQGLVIYGEFTVEETDAPLELTTDWAIAADGGAFQIGTADTPFEGKFDLILAGKDNTNDVDLMDYPDMGIHAGHSGHMSGHTHSIENNNAFLMAMGEGARIEIHTDDADKTTWTQLNRTAEAGSTELRLAEATGWEVGDRIAVASTDFDLDQAEEFTVLAVSGNGRTITLDAPLQYMHYGSVDHYDDPDGDHHMLDMRAEVSLLSRDVTIRGDIDYDPDVPLNEQDDQYGGHTMVHHGGELYLSGVELAYMGQAGILGRYPVHWHEADDVTGQYVENSSIHHSFNKGITVHNTQGALVASNVVYETISHNYYLEERNTYDNVLDGNLGMNARDVGRFGEVRGANDDEPSNFYSPNGDNTWTGNHAAGSEDKGFYFQLRQPETRDFGTFEGNTAHSQADRSFYLNHANLIQDMNPEGSAEAPQRVSPWTVEDLTVFKSNGVYVRGVEGTFTDSAFAEMHTNARFRLNQTIEDSLIVGRTDNVGTPETAQEIAAGRSLPRDGVFQGFQLYDGPAALKNVHFDGFAAEDEAIGLSNAIHKTASFAVEGVTFGDDVDPLGMVNISGGGNSIGNDSWSRGIEDVDGSLTGTPGAMIYQYSSDRDGSRVFNAGENYEIVEEWGAIVTYGQASGTLRLSERATPETNDGRDDDTPIRGLSVTRSDGESASGVRNQMPVFSEYTYTFDFDSIEPQFRLYLHDMTWGDAITVNLGPVPATSSFLVDDPYSDASWTAREVSSLAMLEASPDTAVYRAPDGTATIKLVAEMAHGYLWPQHGAASNNGLHSGVTVLVDTEADLDLGALVFDDPAPGDTLPPPPYTDPPADPDPVPVNTAPEAADDAVDLAHGGMAMVDVLANDTDADGDALTITSVDASDGLSAMIHGGQVHVMADPGFQGAGTVSYEIADGNGGVASADIAVTVVAPPADPEPELVQIGEVHALQLSSTAQTLTFQSTYDDPIVIAKVASYNGDQPVNVRLLDVGPDGVTLVLEEPDYEDGWHMREDVTVFVMEAGTHELADGTRIEAGKLASNAVATAWNDISEFESVDFESDFDDSPTVLSQVQTRNEDSFVVTRQAESNSEGFRVAMQEEEASKYSGREAETIGWIAVERGTADASGLAFEAGQAAARIDHEIGSHTYDAEMDDGPLLLAGISSYYGNNTAVLRVTSSDNAGFSAFVQEEQSLDAEVWHMEETVDFIGFSTAGAIMGYDTNVILPSV